ncbi:kelch-like protein 10 [Antennarius striatus]|uniref:kelch-like protein 10 n=1 Tax=Antennarius striatus TaxID=241820 RepID=UPI0035B3A7ED
MVMGWGILCFLHRNLFCSGSHFTVPDVSAEVMEVIIDFAYSGSVSVTEDNVRDLLIAADFLDIPDIVEACNNFLEENLTPDNCIGVRRFIISRPQVLHKAHFLLMNKFEEVVSSKEFPELSLQELTDILGNDKLNVNEEKTVYEAAVRWINHAPEQRTTHLPALLSKARLALSSPDDIKTLMTDPYLSNNTQCLQILIDALHLKYQLTKVNPQMRYCSNLAARPRLPNTIIFAIGGCSTNDLTNITEVYDARADRWLDITDRRENPCGYHGILFHDGFIYSVGGFDGEESSNSVRKFDMTLHVWLEAAPMNHRRCHVNAVILDGYIYAFGGRDRARRLRSAERYKPESNQWSLIASMHEMRSDGGCAAFNNKIYIFGGFNGEVVLKSCEFYSPQLDQWTTFSDMSTRLCGFGVMLYGDLIFLLGGYDGQTYSRSVETYNPQTNKWHERPPMLGARRNFGTGVINDKLFVIGGFNGISPTNVVQYYDAKTNKWKRACPMRTARWGLSCCVVSNHPSVNQYATSRDSLPRFKEV